MKNFEKIIVVLHLLYTLDSSLGCSSRHRRYYEYEPEDENQNYLRWLQNRKRVERFYFGQGECGVNWYSFYSKESKKEAIEGLTQSGDARDNEFPWQVYIIVTNGAKQIPCSGIVLDSDWVLTSASCVYEAYYNPSRIQLTYGANKQPIIPGYQRRTTFDDYYPYEANVLEIKIHPEYESDNFGHDFAMLRTDANVDFRFKPHIQPICLPKNDLQCGRICISSTVAKLSAGWMALPGHHHRPIKGYLEVRKGALGSRDSLPDVDRIESVGIPEIFSYQTMQKFSGNRINYSRTEDTCNRYGKKFNNASQMCVNMYNEINMNSCLLYPGTSLMAVGEIENNPGIRYWLCGVKSITPKRHFGEGCSSTPIAKYPNSTLTFGNICSVLAWIKSRPVKTTTSTTTATYKPWWVTTFNPPPDFSDYLNY